MAGDTSFSYEEASEWKDATREGDHETKEFYATEAIAAGDWVVLDVGGDSDRLGRAVKLSGSGAAGTDDPTMVGCAKSAIAATEWGEIVIYGPLTVAAVDTGVPAGAAITGGGGAAGRAAESTGAGLVAEAGAKDRLIGYTTVLAAGDVASVFVLCMG